MYVPPDEVSNSRRNVVCLLFKRVLTVNVISEFNIKCTISDLLANIFIFK